MSRHSFDTRHEGRRIRVVAGYDRPLDEFFLQILRAAPGDDAAPDEFVYTSLYEPGGDWSDPQTLGARLAELRIAPPASFLPAILEDRRQRIGNRLAVHHFDRAPEVEDF
jgi:hypothetical protein